MRRTRRLSVEVIRRELSLPLTRAGAANAQAHPASPEEDGNLTPECPACRSRWFMLPAGHGEDSAIMQRVLDAHAIHNQRLHTGELLFCARSFELHTGASDLRIPQTRHHRDRTNLLPKESKS